MIEKMIFFQMESLHFVLKNGVPERFDEDDFRSSERYGAEISISGFSFETNHSCIGSFAGCRGYKHIFSTSDPFSRSQSIKGILFFNGMSC